jgi:hypothetical protein
MTSTNSKVDTDSAESPDKGVGCGALVSLRSFFWWLCIYNKWPLHFVRAASYDLLDAAKDGSRAIWHFLRIPIQPVAMLVAFCLDAGARAEVKAAQARNATRSDPLKFNGTIRLANVKDEERR